MDFRDYKPTQWNLIWKGRKRESLDMYLFIFLIFKISPIQFINFNVYLTNNSILVNHYHSTFYFMVERILWVIRTIPLTFTGGYLQQLLCSKEGFVIEIEMDWKIHFCMSGKFQTFFSWNLLRVKLKYLLSQKYSTEALYVFLLNRSQYWILEGKFEEFLLNSILSSLI